MEDRRLTLTASLRPAGLDLRRGVVRLHPDVFDALGIEPWAPLRLVGGRTCGAIAAYGSRDVPRGMLLCDDLILGNLRLRDGGSVEIEAIPPVPTQSIVVDGPPQFVSSVTAANLRMALLGKVITEGDDVSLMPQDFSLPDGIQAAQLNTAEKQIRSAVGESFYSTLLVTVVSAHPPGPSIVTMDTSVSWKDGPSTHGPGTTEEMPGSGDQPIRAEDLPGVESQARQLREWLDLGFNHRDLLKRLGAKANLGVMITGPAGSGKATLTAAVAAEFGAEVTRIWAPDIAALENNAGAKALREALTTARANTPSVLLIRDVEALAKRDADTPIETVLFEVIREAIGTPKVAVVCTSSHPESTDTRLLHPGMLDHELSFPLPDRLTRRDILKSITRTVPLDSDVNFDEVASRTPGFVAVDLLALVREAGLRAALRQKTELLPTVGMMDFNEALEVVRPTSMTESHLEISHIELDDIGGMAPVKQALTEAVLWPLSFPDMFTRLGIQPPRGVLLYGPPGCGKTYLVKALAGTGQANVLSVKGAELLNKWIGESERAIRELFRRAREAAPTLVFFDEIDALAPVRGGSTDSGAMDRVVASLLTEIDGVEDLRNVVVVGATNRPDLIDPAMLRPGRLERLVYVPPPDAAGRAEILRSVSAKVPLDRSVNLLQLAVELEGFSSADCAALIREAALAAMRKSMDSVSVTAADIEVARRQVRPSLDPKQLASLAAYAARREVR